MKEVKDYREMELSGTVSLFPFCDTDGKPSLFETEITVFPHYVDAHLERICSIIKWGRSTIRPEDARKLAAAFSRAADLAEAMDA